MNENQNNAGKNLRFLQIAIVGAALFCIVFAATYFAGESRKQRDLKQAQLANALQIIAGINAGNQEAYLMSLGSYGKNATPALLRVLESSDSITMAGIGVALRMMDDSILGDLIRLAEDPYVSVARRKSAIKAIAKLGGKKAFETLLKITLNPMEIYVVRDQAVILLSEFGTPELIEPLLKLLADEDRARAGQFYVSAMDTLLDVANRLKATRQAAVSDTARRQIADGLGDKEKPHVRFLCVKFTEALQAKDLLPAVAELAKNDPEVYLRDEAKIVGERLTTGNWGIAKNDVNARPRR